MPLTSLSITDDRLDQLRALFPEAFSEGLVDFEKLRLLLGDAVDTGPERYGLSWAGKAEAFQSLRIPATGTLRPCPEESVNFESSENLIIEGDNLEVLKLLQKSYYGKVKMIYIDPPYNTGNDFIYKDDFRDGLNNYLRFSGQMDDEGNATTSDKEKSGRLHSNWLNMMYPRLYLARNLLRDDGVIFVSIDDNEVHNLRMLMNEVFGEDNFLASFMWNKQHSQQQGIFKKYHEYIILYGKNSNLLKNISGGTGNIDAGALKKISKANPASDFTFPAGVRFEAKDGTSLTGTYGDSEAVTVISGNLLAKNGKTSEEVTLRAGWTQKDQMTNYFNGNEVIDTKGQRVIEFYFSSSGKLKCLKDRSTITPPTILPPYGMVSEQTDYLDSLFGCHIFDNPKPREMIADFASWFCSEEDMFIDFFGGSGTSAEAILNLNEADGGNRKYILVQLPEKTDKPEYPTIAHITRERVRRVIKKIEAARTETTAQTDMLETGDAEKPVLGFRALRLASSNFRLWDSRKTTDTSQLTEQLDLHVDNVDSARSEQDILFEIILKAGLSLSANISAQPFAEQQAFMVNDGEQQLLVCLASPIAQETIDAMRAAKPKRIVCLDNAFSGNDALKTNTVLQMRDAGIHFRTA